MVASIIDKVPEDVFESLRELGIPANLQGYNYLGYAINLVAEDPSVINKVTKVIYPSVAKSFHTTSTRVERCMRHAVITVFNHYLNDDVVSKYFGNSLDANKDHPTSSQFIAAVAHYIRKCRLANAS